MNDSTMSEAAKISEAGDSNKSTSTITTTPTTTVTAATATVVKSPEAPVFKEEVQDTKEDSSPKDKGGKVRFNMLT